MRALSLLPPSPKSFSWMTSGLINREESLARKMCKKPWGGLPQSLLGDSVRLRVSPLVRIWATLHQCDSHVSAWPWVKSIQTLAQTGLSGLSCPILVDVTGSHWAVDDLLSSDPVPDLLPQLVGSWPMMPLSLPALLSPLAPASQCHPAWEKGFLSYPVIK